MIEGLRRDPLLSRYEGWRAFAETPPQSPPERLTAGALRQLSNEARDEYNERRGSYHSTFLVRTPAVGRILTHLWDLVESSRQGPDRVKGAAVIDAPPALGKSTVANAFGREFHLQQVHRHGSTLDGGQTEHIPVCRVGFTGSMTTRALNESILNFYAHPAADSARNRYLRNRNLATVAADCVHRHGTRLIIVDDVHFLRIHTQEGVAVANELKWLANEYPATFLFTGVDMGRTGLLSEGHRDGRTAMSQTARRWTLLSLEPFKPPALDEQRTWDSLLATIEVKLVLAHAGPGMLRNESDYLYARSSGIIGSLFELIIRACARAIRNGDERLTRELFEEVRIDAAAEDRRAPLEAELAAHASAKRQLTRPSVLNP